MYTNNPLLPWQQAVDNAARSLLHESIDTMHANRAIINDMLNKTNKQHNVSSTKLDKVQRLSESPLLANGKRLPESIAHFMLTGQPTTFDVIAVPSPLDFSLEYNFEIAFLQELIPICLASFNTIFDHKDYSETAFIKHNMRMASEIQTFIATQKDPIDIATVNLKLAQASHIEAHIKDGVSNLAKDIIHSLSKHSFEERMCRRLCFLLEGNNFFSYETTPNNYLFSQKLAIQFGLDTNLNVINPDTFQSYLRAQCPVKTNYDKFDFLKSLFILNSILQTPIEHRHFSLFYQLNSFKNGHHGIVDALNDFEESVSDPRELHTNLP